MKLKLGISFLFLALSFSLAVAAAPLVSNNAKIAAEHAVSQYKNVMVFSLGEMVKFKTVANPNLKMSENSEFIGFRKWFLNKCEKLQLTCSDHESVLLASIGSGPKVLGLITHGDVQPANASAWKQDPFSLDRSDPEKLIGRGTEDDKGPIAAALYALKSVQDLKLPLKGQVELLVYMAEESDWSELENFLTTYRTAPVNIALDSEYPVVTAEKAWSHIELGFTEVEQLTVTDLPQINSFKGGAFASQIPENAIAELGNISKEQLESIRTKLETFPITYSITGQGNHAFIAVKGRAAHSSKPEYGVNAVNYLAQALKHIQWQPSAPAHSVQFLNDLVGLSLHAEQFGNLAYQHEFMGKLTLSPTKIGFNEQQKLFINLRRPIGPTKDAFKKQLIDISNQWATSNNIAMTVLDAYVGEPLWVQNAPHTPTLLNVFSHFANQPNPQPIAIGGSTNAKLFPNAVSFGPTMPGAEYTGHSEHEFIRKDILELTLKMYTAAIVEIAGQ